MTTPLSVEEKKRCKETVLKTLFRINKQVTVIKECLMLSDEHDFDSDYIVMAKNMALSIQTSSQNIEHVLHDILYTPNVE